MFYIPGRVLSGRSVQLTVAFLNPSQTVEIGGRLTEL